MWLSLFRCTSFILAPLMNQDKPATMDIHKDDEMHWLSTADAAALLGVSPRAVQRRAERGTLNARRVKRGSREHWEVDAGDVVANMDANTSAVTSPDVRATVAECSPIALEDVRDVVANTSPDVRDIDRDFHAHLIEENKFLRATVEQLQRDGAEVRAALREALKSAPKVLTAGTDESALSIQTKAHEEAGDTDTGKAANGPQSAAQRKRSGSKRRENKLRSIARLIFSR